MRLSLLPLCLGLVGALAVSPPALAQFDVNLVPTYTIWDIEFGQPISQIPPEEVAEIACGTNGGPPSTPLKDFSEFEKCPAEKTGLHEVFFTNDDEADYIAKALEAEHRVMQGGTSIYAHPVVFSVLIDGKGIARGIRIVTDERAVDRERRVAMTLSRNLKSRYGRWAQSGNVAVYASEDLANPVVLTRGAQLALALDPLDGSSNIDTNASIGTIFSILPIAGDPEVDPLQSFLQPGRAQVAAGFFVSS